MTKRKRGSASNAEVQEGAGTKRSRTSGSLDRVPPRSITYGRVDPTYGQRSAIPGLDDFEDWDWEGRDGGEGNGEGGGGENGGDGEGGDGEEEDEYYAERVDGEALRYLRGVREEASGIPTLLVAPRALDGSDSEGGFDRGIYDDGVGDSRGFYEDGAYTAAPIDPDDEEDAALSGEAGGTRDVQHVYYEALIGRFETLRKQLSQVPPRHAVEQLDADHGCHMSGSPKDYELWRWRIANTDPRPAQLANMDKGTVLRILNVVGDSRRGFLSTQKLLGDDTEQTRKRVSAWTWGLLAKLPDRGEMISEEVGVVREFGKRAVWVGVELKGVVDMESLKEQIEDDGEAEDEEGGIMEAEIEERDTEMDLEEDDASSGNEEEEDLRVERNGSSSPAPRFPSSMLNHKNTPFIGPISPESVRGGRAHRERLIGDGLNRETVEDGDREQRKVNEEEEREALAQARANLLARLQSHNNAPPESSLSNSSPRPPASADMEKTAEDDIPNSNPHLTATPNTQSQDIEHQQAVTQLPPSSQPQIHTIAIDGGNINQSADTAAQTDKSHQHKQENGYEAPSPTTAVKTLLDMIITVSGEVYGQRDLLEFRERWS